jgi:hypothetical protein
VFRHGSPSRGDGTNDADSFLIGPTPIAVQVTTAII